MGDMMREIWEDEQRRRRLTPLARAVEEVETQRYRVTLAKDRLRDELRGLQQRRAEVARLRKAGAK